jgi:hypothetical protein
MISVPIHFFLNNTDGTKGLPKMKSLIPIRWGGALMLAATMLAGCSNNTPAQSISSSFVPAGYSHQYSPQTARNFNVALMAAGDPNVSASVKAHVIRGLPPQSRPGQH